MCRWRHPTPRGLLVAAHPAPSDPSTMLLKHPFKLGNLNISTRREDTQKSFPVDAFMLHVEDRLQGPSPRALGTTSSHQGQFNVVDIWPN